jgi:hypothetical protein
LTLRKVNSTSTCSSSPNGRPFGDLAHAEFGVESGSESEAYSVPMIATFSIPAELRLRGGCSGYGGGVTGAAGAVGVAGVRIKGGG